VSDRKDLLRSVMMQRMLTGLETSHALEDVMTRLETDVDYLASKKLMDYSLLVYGSVIELKHDDAGSRDFFSPRVATGKEGGVNLEGHLGKPTSYIDPMAKHTLQSAVALAPQCGMACSSRPRQLVDVTRQLHAGGDVHLTWSGKDYRCCCLKLKPGDSALVKSPCALVRLSADGKTDCGGLLGSGFHAYERSKVGGRCLVEWDQWPETLGHVFISGHTLYHQKKLLDQTSLQQTRLASRVEACAVVCVSVVDYLLHSSTWKQVENIALIPVYRERKWSDYDTRTVRLLRCLIGGQPPTEPLPEDQERAGLLRLFVLDQPNGPLSHNKLTWKECKNEFPEVSPSDDLKVVEGLVRIKL